MDLQHQKLKLKKRLVAIEERKLTWLRAQAISKRKMACAFTRIATAMENFIDNLD